MHIHVYLMLQTMIQRRFLYLFIPYDYSVASIHHNTCISLIFFFPLSDAITNYTGIEVIYTIVSLFIAVVIAEVQIIRIHRNTTQTAISWIDKRIFF